VSKKISIGKFIERISAEFEKIMVALKVAQRAVNQGVVQGGQKQ